MKAAIILQVDAQVNLVQAIVPILWDHRVLQLNAN
jgi:hypothetical protein